MGGSGLHAGAGKKFVPFFGLTLSPDKVREVVNGWAVTATDIPDIICVWMQ